MDKALKEVIEKWLKGIFNNKQKALEAGKELEKFRPQLAEKYKISPSNTLYRCVLVKQDVLKKNKPLVLENREYSSWTYDVNRAKRYCDSGVYVRKGYPAIILKRIFSNSEIFLNMEQLSKALFISSLADEKEIVVKNIKKNFTFQPNEIILIKEEDRGPWKKFESSQEETTAYYNWNAVEIQGAKQVGSLYHYTSFLGAFNILKENVIYEGIHKGISFTRNKNLHKTPAVSIKTQVRLEIDGDKLAEHYKLEPYTYPGTSFKKSRPFYEAEERVRKDKITNVHKYIKSIKIFKKAWPDLEKMKPFFVSRLSQFIKPLTFENYVQYLKRYNIPVYISTDSVKIMSTFLKISKLKKLNFLAFV